MQHHHLEHGFFNGFEHHVVHPRYFLPLTGLNVVIQVANNAVLKRGRVRENRWHMIRGLNRLSDGSQTQAFAARAEQDFKI